MFSERGAKQRAVRREHCRVVLLEPLDQFGRMVDVSKEKRHGSIGQPDHQPILALTIWQGRLSAGIAAEDPKRKRRHQRECAGTP
jgi:hypothetical protein